MGAVFDSGALIALERGNRALAVLVDEARRQNERLTVPAGCLAQVWRQPARQARLAAFLRLANVDVVSLDDEDARLIGLLIARARKTDVVDGHVALCGQRLDAVVFTSDPDDLRALVPRLDLQRV